MDLIFQKLYFVNTSFYVTYSNANSSHIFQCQGPILQVCGAHPITLIVTWLSSVRQIYFRSCDQRKIITKRLKD